VKYADSLVFLDMQAQPPVAAPDLSDHLSLAMVTAAPPFMTDFEQVLGFVKQFAATIGEQSQLRLVLDTGDLIDDGRTGIVLGLQNSIADCDAGKLQQIFDLGIRVIGIGYDEQNELGSGFLHPEIGLSEAGRQFIYDCAKIGLTIDLSHSSHQTAVEAVNEVRKLRSEGGYDIGVMASHGGCYEVFEDLRNLTLQALNGILRLDGYIGVYTLTFSLHANDDTPNAFFRHLRIMEQVAKPRGFIGVGSDAVYQDLEIKDWKAKFAWMQAKLDPDGAKGSRWPDFPVELNGVDRMQRIDTFLTSEGYDEEIRERLLGGDFMTFLATALPPH
jgi:membrane dipeptidase